MSDGARIFSPMNEYDTTAARMRARRAYCGLTQAQLAEAVGVSQPTIGAYERGHREPTLNVLCRIARVLGVEPVDLIGDDDG